MPEPRAFDEAAQRALRDDAASLRLPSRLLEWLAARFTRSAGSSRAALPASRPAGPERVR